MPWTKVMPLSGSRSVNWKSWKTLNWLTVAFSAAPRAARVSAPTSGLGTSITGRPPIVFPEAAGAGRAGEAVPRWSWGSGGAAPKSGVRGVRSERSGKSHDAKDRRNDFMKSLSMPKSETPQRIACRTIGLRGVLLYLQAVDPSCDLPGWLQAALKRLPNALDFQYGGRGFKVRTGSGRSRAGDQAHRRRDARPGGDQEDPRRAAGQVSRLLRPGALRSPRAQVPAHPGHPARAGPGAPGLLPLALPRARGGRERRPHVGAAVRRAPAERLRLLPPRQPGAAALSRPAFGDQPRRARPPHPGRGHRRPGRARAQGGRRYRRHGRPERDPAATGADGAGAEAVDRAAP